ncbi:hypothetical protein H8N03_16650 [Ramlibacter sp. USB13]|uniref:Uncharacterized protein n=1 Tax=Ramlibacter cellulosilyticus TaxID=2764187 RepID=A0A923MSB8_9BURK|nr:hypothetical protein [Ramlibacter cellulosilyticus]MBC5784580.1 hypothetical protein [Ramlibacter cellulosilyticus]
MEQGKAPPRVRRSRRFISQFAELESGVKRRRGLRALVVVLLAAALALALYDMLVR